MEKVKTSLFFVAMAAVLALSGSARATQGLISYWRFNEAGGTTAYDSIGDNDGTIYEASWTTGIFGGALSFDGVNDYINVGNDTSLTNLTPTAMTIEAWVYNTQTIATGTGTVDLRTIVAQREYYSYRGYGLSYGYVGGYGYDDYVVDIAFWNGYEGYSTYHILPNQWYHIVGVFENNVGTIYINGVAQTTWSPGTSGYESSNDDVMIGRLGNWSSHRLDYHSGTIDEVAIWNRTLTPEEIQQHYWNGLHGQGYLAIEVAIDIKPGAYLNTINLGSHGLIPVAILSSEDFDATSVDPDTVELGGADVAVRGKGNKFLAHEEDVNADGLLDLVVQVATANLDPGSFQDGYAVLTGTTYGGLPIWGVDEIIIVPLEE